MPGKQLPESPESLRENRLRGEKSPYLLLHASNPVDWYPWGEEAFARAKKEDKPVFLSIGYSSCHWCHVMEKESFTDREIAGLLKENFIAVKVDREERPELDSIYMTVCQLMTGGGGWPLTIIISPDKVPFFAATYLPREPRFGKPGLKQLLPLIAGLWKHRRKEIRELSEKLLKALEEVKAAQPGGEGELKAELMEEAYGFFARTFDPEGGGFGSAPKFPAPHNLLFLLNFWKSSRNPQALLMVEKSLEKMRLGGIYDQVGFGFHRYSTDESWLLPHFEKMLYDQALHLMAYSAAFQATGKDLYRQTAEEIITYLLREMASPEGGFYTSQDADSQGREGLFYLWSFKEVKRLLSPEEAGLVSGVFNLKANGNFREEAGQQRTGSNIFYLKKPLPQIAAELKIPLLELKTRLEKARQKLFAVRAKRTAPLKDQKILTDWNGLMIAALARASRAFNQPAYLKAAQKARNFILKKLPDPNGRLRHCYYPGGAKIPAFLDDYAFLIWGLLELYQTDFKAENLKTAVKLNLEMLGHFWDEKEGGFYFTPQDSPRVLLREKKLYDGAIPSGNSVALLDLLLLARLTGREEYREKAGRLMQSFSATVESSPASFGFFLLALDFELGTSVEVVIAGDFKAKATQNMLAALNREFIPNKVVLLKSTQEEKPEILSLAPFLADKNPLSGKTTAFVCRNFSCRLPVTKIAEMLKLLELE